VPLAVQSHIAAAKPLPAAGAFACVGDDARTVAPAAREDGVLEPRRRVVLSTSLLGWRRRVQREGEVIHIVAETLGDLSNLLRNIGGGKHAFAAPHGCGDGATHPNGTDAREVGEYVKQSADPLIGGLIICRHIGDAICGNLPRRRPQQEARMVDGKVAIVTGAAGNVGVALMKLLAARGAHVAALDRSADAMAARLGPASDGLHLPVADLSDPAQVAAAVGAVVQRFRRLDGVAATVGAFAMAPVTESTPELWERMLRVNLLSTATVFSAALPHLRAAGGGSLVAVAAGAALRAPGGMAAYAAAKSAVLRLVEALSDEGKPDRIRVNAVLPGTIDTPQNRVAMPDADPARWVTPKQVAEAMVFLLSDASSGVTGAALQVTGFG